MKQLKGAVFGFLTLVLLFSGTWKGYAAGEIRVFDMAGLFDEEETARLSDSLGSLREKMNMDAAIVTTEENTDSAMEFADNFYEEQGLGVGKNHDGVLFLIDLENGELWITTEGKMVRFLTDGRVETILDDAFEYAVDGDFYGAARTFLEDLEICYDNGIAEDQFNQDVDTGKISRYHSIKWYEVLFALAVSAACGIAAVFSVVWSYGMHDKSGRLAANFNLSYRKDSSFRLGNLLTDVIIGSYVTQRVIRSTQERSGGGHSSGGRSLSSGGRSSVHRSFSGRSHGGGGRKFR